jgi:predicted phosphodiesterase
MIAILSDVHGNFPALTAVLSAIDALDCRRIYSLGDVCGYYCRVNECIEALRVRAIPHLLGNHDDYLARNIKCPRSRSANQGLAYQQRIITPENLEWVRRSHRSLELADWGGISLRHGGWNDPLDEYLHEIPQGYFDGRWGRIFCSGHTHVQQLVPLDGRTYCNPGSVGQPRDGDPRAAFATIEDGRIELHRVEYAICEIVDSMRAAGFDEPFTANLHCGRGIGAT